MSVIALTILTIVICLFEIFFPSTGIQAAAAPSVPADIAFMLCATALVLFMTPGLSFFYGGMVSSKNMLSTMLQSFICMAGISILWVVFGFSLSFGDSLFGVIGNPMTYFMFKNVGEATHPTLSPTIPLALFALFQLKFAIITPALITGAFAERIRFRAFLLFTSLFSILIYSPLAHWTWHPDGFLRKMGVLDFAGGTVVHISAGISALVGAFLIGKREQISMQPANIPFVLLGTGMLWFGWFGFNGGSALAANGLAVTAFLTTNTASAAGMLVWLVCDLLRNHKPSSIAAANGAIVGLVAITPAAGYVTVGASVLIGAVAAMISNSIVHWKTKSYIDDTLDVFPCHGVGGIVGMILTGVFAKQDGLIYGKPGLFFTQMVGLFVVIAFVLVGSYVIYKITNLIIPIRVSGESERIGLDKSQHGE